MVVQLHYLTISGAFKTLDRDNNGTIKVNIQEVKQSVIFHQSFTDFERVSLYTDAVCCVFAVASVDHVLLNPEFDSFAVCYTEPLCPHGLA